MPTTTARAVTVAATVVIAGSLAGAAHSAPNPYAAAPLASAPAGGLASAPAAGTAYVLRPTGAIVRIAPTGAQTVVTKAPVPASSRFAIRGVSDDGRYLLGSTHLGRVKVYVHDLVTKKWSAFTGPDSGSAPLLTRGAQPRVVVAQIGGPPSLHVYDLSGRETRTIAVGYASTNPIPGRAAGTVVVTGPDRVSLQVINAGSGSVVTTLRGAPAGWDCQPVSWWSATAVLASCLHDQSGYLGPADLIAFAAGGATKLTNAARDHNTYLRGWRTTGLPLVSYLPPAGDPTSYGRLKSDGTLVRESLGLAASTRPAVWTVVGTRAYVEHSPDALHRTKTLATYDLGTRKLTSLGKVDSSYIVSP